MASAAHSRDPSLDAEWEEWKKKFEKTYSPDEEGHRRALWEENKKIIEKHNAEYEQGKTSYTMGLNQFSDMDEEGHRRMVWEENKKKIEEHNRDYEQGKRSFCMGLNELSDLVSGVGIANTVVFLSTFFRYLLVFNVLFAFP
ncbi:Protein CTLA-2-beta [Lemmus lemmus]